jgi:glycosyltransferase involved in cell wall biosynthesis
MMVIKLQDLPDREIDRTQKQENSWLRLSDIGRIKDWVSHLSDFNNITGLWKDEPVLIIGAGPSLSTIEREYINKLPIKKIAINHVSEYGYNFDALVCLDKRFFDKTSFDYKNYEGIIFAGNGTGYTEKNAIVFRPQSTTETPTENMSDGVHNGMLSGLAALHIAIILQCSPIYLIGIDCGGGTADSFHAWIDYPGRPETKDKTLLFQKHQKYKGTARFFKAFDPWKEKIYNLSPISNIQTFQKVDHSILKKHESATKKSTVKVYPRNPIICHVQTMPMEKMGDITRQIHERGEGKHIWCNINGEIPLADLYVMHCFINGANKFIHFQRPHKNAKIISIIHSSSSCMPSIHSDAVVTLTKAHQEIMRRKGIQSTMIYGAIDTSIYKTPDYSTQVFGRITRWSKGKINAEWNDICVKTLNKYPLSKCIMYTDNTSEIHDRYIFDNSITIADHKAKAEALNRLSIYAVCQGTFIETFSLGLLEGMAAALPVVILSQVTTNEVLGGAGIVTDSPAEFKKVLHALIESQDMREEYGKKSLARAKQFTIDRMVKQYDQLIMDTLCK